MTASQHSGEEPAVSVVIAALDAEGTIGVQLQALAEQRCESRWEVIVADNGSRDRTVDVALGFRDVLPLTVVDASEVRGAGPARNAGANAARGALLAFCDADDVVDPGWLEAVAAAGSEHRFITGPLRQVAPGTDDVPAPRYSSHSFLGLDVAPSNNCAVARSSFLSVGGFDAEVLIAQDADLSLRLRRTGLVPRRIDSMVVSARDRVTARAYFRQHFRYGYWDVAVYKRHRTALQLRRDRLGRVLRAYVGLIVWFPRLFGPPEVRRQWLAPAAKRTGRLCGSARRHVFLL